MLPFITKRALSNTLSALALSSLFVTQASYAQEQNPSEPDMNETNMRALLQDMSDDPLAGATLMLEVCGPDEMGAVACAMEEVTLPLPDLNNPLGYEIQYLRRDLALMIEQARRGDDGAPLPEDLSQGAIAIAQRFEEVLDAHSLEFKNPETLMRVMDLHYVIVNSAQEGSLEQILPVIEELHQVVGQLEDDLLSATEKALRDALEAQAKALEEGASSEELEALNDAVMEAMENYLEEQSNKGEDEGLSPEDMKNMEHMKELMEALAKMLEEMGITPEEFAQMMQEMMGGGSPPDGSPPAAQQEQSLEEMLEALRQQIETMQKLYKYIRELNAITDELQALRDTTLSESLEAQREAPDAGDFEEMQEMEETQDSLNERLKPIIEGMRGDSLPVEGLEQALREMEEAEKDLDRYRTGEAVVHQDNALDILNQSSQSMAMMMMMMPGSGNQSGQGAMAMPPSGQGDNGRNIIDEDGRLRDSSNQNEDLGVELDDQGNGSRDIRDSIIRRQQNNGDQGPSNNNGYLDRLLEDPFGP